MGLTTLVALFQIVTSVGAGDAPLSVEIRPAPAPAISVRLVFTDEAGTVLKDEKVPFERGAAKPLAPPGTLFVQALGPGTFSERAFTRGGELVELAALPTGVVRIGPVPSLGNRRPVLFAALDGPHEMRRTAQFEVLESAHGTADGVPWSSFRIPTGRYGFAIERGPALPVLVAAGDVLASQESFIVAKELQSRALTIGAFDAAARKPLRGARLDGITFETPNRALAVLLAKRVAPAGENGVMDLALVPAESPLSVRIKAAGFRPSTLKLGALFEAGRRDVFLVSNPDVEVRVSGLTTRRGEARPGATLARCRNQQPRTSCFPFDPRREPIDDNGRARFPRVDAGIYQAELRIPGLGTTHKTVEVAQDGGDETLVVDMPVAEWTFRGTTHLHGGAALPARVDATEFVDGLGEGTAASTVSAADGTFELSVVSTRGNRIGLRADSDDPKAVTTSHSSTLLSDDRPLVEGIDLELDATGLEIAVRDARTNEQLPGCPVDLTWDKIGEASSKSMTRNADDLGLVREYGLAEGVVRVAVNCSRHYAKDVGRVDVVRDEMKHLDVRVDPAQDLVLVAVDERDAPLPGVTAMILASPLSYYTGAGRMGAVATVGSTDAQGEVLLRGDRYGGKPYFLVMGGRALAMGVLPSPASCDRPEDCRVKVALRPPAAFGGLTIRRQSETPARFGRYALSKAGIPIPLEIISTVLAANGIGSDAPSPVVAVSVAAFLSEGVYTLKTYHFVPAAAGKSTRPVDSSVGTFMVPSFERVELVDADGPAAKP